MENITTKNILSIVNSFNCANEEARAQNKLHEENPRCKPANFSASAYYLNRLNTLVGLPVISKEEVETMIRNEWSWK